MAGMETTRSSKLLDLSTLLTTGLSYWLHINPLAKREMKHWQNRASSIPDGTLRAQATHKLTGEKLNPEAAALFAILAPRRSRKGVVRLIVAFQIAYDYLDAINEAPNTANLQNGRTLHQALTDAVSQGQPHTDYYRYHPQTEDGGYLKELVDVCRSELARLPSRGSLQRTILNATSRCGEAQYRNHAVAVEGQQQLIDWSTASSDRHGYLWWELAAGGISSLGIHALLATAARPTTVEEAQRLDAAYFPPVCGLSALLDSLVDHAEDIRTTNHSFVNHYENEMHAAHRFGLISAEAHDLLRPLNHCRRHKLLLVGIAAFYLSASEADTPFARPVAARTIAQFGPPTNAMLTVMRLMRRHAGVSSTDQQRPENRVRPPREHSC